MKYLNASILALLLVAQVAFGENRLNEPERQSEAASAESAEALVRQDIEAAESEGFTDWQDATSAPSNLRIEQVDAVAPVSSGLPIVAIVIDSALYSQISSEISRLAWDMLVDGFRNTTYRISGGTHQELRAWLREQDSTHADFVGALLIGDLPIVWYSSGGIEEGAIDHYFMDMDGGWGDNDADGMLDTVWGDISPEIFIGRLRPSPLIHTGETEAELMRKYLDKNHLYRTGGLQVAHRALVFKERDFGGYGEGASELLWPAYRDQTWVTYDDATVANYEYHLSEGYEQVILWAHGTAKGHRLENLEWFRYYHLVDETQLRCHFFNLFSCNTGRYTAEDYIAGWYIFSDSSYGLICNASTTYGGISMPDDYFAVLGEGGCFGPAMFKSIENSTIPNFWTMAGDPTLKAVYCDGSAPDADGDNAPDDCDNCLGLYNPDQIDVDGDYHGDACDTCIDTDDDGYGNPGYGNACPDDNCPNAYNPEQEDADNDGIGDACDECTDPDGDGFGNPGLAATTCTVDNCPDIYNPNQADGDSDGVGDICDNCPSEYNPDQRNSDGDDYGNACDNCPYVYNPDQLDSDANGSGDLCDCYNEDTDAWTVITDFDDLDGLYSLRRLDDETYLAAGLTGTTTLPNQFIIRYNECGQIVAFDTVYAYESYDLANDAIMSPDGGYVTAGTFLAVEQATLIKKDELMDYEWLMQLGMNGLAVTGVPGGGYIMVGGFDGALAVKVDDYGSYSNLLRRGTGEDLFHDIISTADGNFLAVGVKYDNQGFSDVYVAKLSPTLQVLWEAYPGKTANTYDAAFSVAETSNGGFIIAGTRADAAGLGDYLVLRLNSDSSLVWCQTYGDAADDDNGAAVAIDTAGNYLVTGYSDALNSPDYSPYTIKLDANGNLLKFRWSLQGGNHKAHGVVVAGDGKTIIAGESNNDFYIEKFDFDEYLCGDVNADGLINDDDVDYLLAYLFMSGPPPVPLESGDVDCTPGIDLGDLTYLNAFVNVNGPAPCDCGGQPKPLSSEVSVRIVAENGETDTRLTMTSPIEIAAVEMTLYGAGHLQPTPDRPVDQEWIRYNDDESTTIYIVDLDGGNVFAAGTHSLLSYTGDWRLEAATVYGTSGQRIEINLKGAGGDAVPVAFALDQNYPNPFNPVTSIHYALPVDTDVHLSVFNILGQKVRGLVDTKQEAGYHSVDWDGTDDNGRAVASGIYFYKLDAGDFVDSKKMVLLK